MGRVATQSGFLTASLPAPSSEAIPTAHPLNRTVAASDSRPSGQGSTSLSNETHFQDEKTILDDQRPARGADGDSNFHEVITRPGNGNGLAPGMEAAVDDKISTGQGDGSATLDGHPSGDCAGLGGGIVGKSVADSFSEELAKLGRGVGIKVGKPVGNFVGKPVGKPDLKQQVQQVTPKSKVEWYRYELDFRPLKNGHTVLLRKRLRWSDTRHVKTVIKRTCPRLTKKMIAQISVGKFASDAIVALQDGGINDGFIKALQQRIGKGNGQRRTDLTDFERSLLARIESGIRAGNRGRNRDT